METPPKCPKGYGDKGPFWPSSNRPCEYPVAHVQLMYKIGIALYALVIIISANGILVFVTEKALPLKQTWASLFSSCGYYLELCLCGLIIGSCYISCAAAYLKDVQYSIMIDETYSILSTIYGFGGNVMNFIILRRGLQRAHIGSVGRETEKLKRYFDQLSLIPKFSLLFSFCFAVLSCIDQRLWIICFLSGCTGKIHFVVLVCLYLTLLFSPKILPLSSSLYDLFFGTFMF